MAVIRYEAETESGNVYLIEDHTKPIGMPTWFIHIEGKPYIIHILATEGKTAANAVDKWLNGGKLPENIFRDKTLVPGENKFVGRFIVYSDHHDPHKANQTAKTSKITEFRRLGY